MEGSNMETAKFELLLAIILIVLVLAVFALLFLVISLYKKYKVFLRGKSGKDLEDSIFQRFKEIDDLKKEARLTSEKLDIACETLTKAFQKIGMVKYDAFSEQGGKLSFSLCLLNDDDNGFIITSIYSREGSNSYIKEIIKGQSYVVMSTEERKALTIAQKGTNFIDEN